MLNITAWAHVTPFPAMAKNLSNISHSPSHGLIPIPWSEMICVDTVHQPSEIAAIRIRLTRSLYTYTVMHMYLFLWH